MIFIGPIFDFTLNLHSIDYAEFIIIQALLQEFLRGKMITFTIVPFYFNLFRSTQIVIWTDRHRQNTNPVCGLIQALGGQVYGKKFLKLGEKQTNKQIKN